MRVAYTIPVRPEVPILLSLGACTTSISGATLRWQTEEDNQLKALIVEFSGARIQYTSDGVILPRYPELSEQAFQIARYMANRIFIATEYDALSPSAVFDRPPVLLPENAEEEAQLRTRPKRVWETAPMEIHVTVPVDPTECSDGIDHANVYEYYAEALRASVPTMRFTWLYRVLECFFAERGPSLDKAVSAHVSYYSPTYTPSVVGELRWLRNRCIHPRAESPQMNLQSMAHDSFPELRELVDILITNPPAPKGSQGHPAM
jgi:hypothetical protein